MPRRKFGASAGLRHGSSPGRIAGLRNDRSIQSLRQRLSRRYELREETIHICGREYRFTRVACPEKVLDAVAAAEARGIPGRMPYWAELWESSLGLATWLASPAAGRSELPGPLGRFRADGSRQAGASGVAKALDLGCGMGFAGMVAASLGWQVLLADLEPDSLLFASLNCAAWRQNVRVRRLDWRSDRLTEKFDLILGADVLYEPAQWEFLEHFWREHLRDGGRVILGEPGRQTGTAFVDWIRSRGWGASIDEVRLESRPGTIRVFALTAPPPVA
ncbi:MAG: class I SAM-dependent methyltransferase [Phycisphaerales bacterium]|nr:class I SAM-dependent methyltransferase [Phycisphaerales bacterium]